MTMCLFTPALLALFAPLLAPPPVSAQEFTAGHLFVASRGNNKVIEYDAALAKIGEIDVSGLTTQPVGVSFGPNGHLYVTSDAQDHVIEIDRTGNSFGTPFGPGVLSLPKSIVFGPFGNLFITSCGTDEVVEYTPAGGLVRQFGTGNLDGPFDAVIAPGGHILVASFGNNRIVEFDISSVFIRDIGVASGVLDPRGIAIMPDGKLGLTSQSPTSSVYLFDSTGANTGTISGVANMGSAHGIAIGSDNSIYVSSLDNNNVVRFNAGGQKLGEADGTTGLSEAYHCAFAPYRFKAMVRGKLVKSGQKTVNVSGPAIVSYSPGAKQVFVQLVDDPKKAADPFNALNRVGVVFHGFETTSLDPAPSRIFQGTEVGWPTLSAGQSSLAARVTGKTDATTGFFTVGKLAGSITIASSASGTFFGTFTTSTLLNK